MAAGAPSTKTPSPQPAPALPASFASGRYQVQRFLGEGGKKRVYLAHDTRLDREVAIAVIKTEGLDEAGLARVRREAQAMGRLGSHPHIVTVLDTADESGLPYIVQEFMEGGSLDDLLQEAEKHRLPLDQTLRIAGQVCQALEHAHGQSIIHRDLKPGNVFLTQTKDAKLGDFGLARAIDRSRISAEGMMVGTSLYMPPEQALGGEVTPRSDLYSLGCVLYEMVAARPPFVGDDPTAVISQHVNTAPVAPSWHTEHCPPDLEELILRLLAKDPGERPESAIEVQRVLEQVDPTQKSASHEQVNVLERLARGVFVGRERELERLRKAFDGAFAGHGGMVMLVGEPGIGKTRTAQELETYARMRGAQVLWGIAHESAGAPAYWPWIQVGRMYGSTNDIAQLQPDMQGADTELVRIFPELRQQALGIGEPEPVTDPEAAQFRLFDAYATFVRAMASRTPLLIALDDLHWADKPSLLLLQHLARELSRMRVLVVSNYRDTELSRTHPLSEALATLNRESGFQRIVLRGLTQGEVAGYIRQAANVEPRRDLLERLYEETEGNPFFLSEVINLLTQEGALTKDSVSDIAVPDGVREALGRRLDRISEEANELLQVAAVAGREFAYETLTLLGDREEEELLRLIEEALEARVIEEMEQPGRYRFTHALMQETLLDELSTTRRVRLHGQIGEALERRWGDRADERATRLAQHFVEAAMLTPRHAEKAVRYSKLAAQQAEAQSAWDLAARQYEACLALVSEAEDGHGEDEAALLTALGRCQTNGGTFRPAWRSLMRAITLYRERADWPGAAKATVLALDVPAPPDRYRALLNAALDAPGTPDPHLEALLRVGRFSLGVEEDRDRVAELISVHGFADVQAALNSRDGLLAWNQARVDEALRLQGLAAKQFQQVGDLRGSGAALRSVAGGLWWSGRLDEAETAFSELLRYSREVHNVWEVENALGFLGSIALLRCDLDRVRDLAAEMVPGRSYLRENLLVCLAEFAGAWGAVVDLLPPVEMTGGVRYMGLHVHGTRARVLLGAGDEGRARAELDAWAEALWGGGAASPTPGDVGHLEAIGPCLAILGDDDLVRRVYEVCAQAPFVQSGYFGSVDHLRGSLALRLGRIDEAEQRLRTGLEWCERERCPVEAGRCLQGLAEVAERRGDATEALRLLDRAAPLFQQHGAKLYLDQVIGKKVKLQGIASGDIDSSIGAVAAIVESEQPDLRPHAAPDGTVTLLFTDIEDSTPLNERLGDQRWLELLRAHNALVREQVREHDGYEVKTEGDGFMLAFSSARRALQCAIAVQRAFAQQNESAEEPVRVRIGLHTGEALKEADDFYGRHVVLASRIADEARGGEILASSLLKELTESAGDIGFGEGREVELKGLSGRQQVYEVGWE